MPAGIDGAAHRGALDARGRTIAVLGCGIDVAYPPEHRGLADSIVEGRGAILSELPLGTAPLPENFPGHNRILSGLSLGVVIVEAAEKSGSLITARMALEQDRQVFAVPGSPLSGETRGSNRLLREGAVLVECVEDVIEDLAPQMAGKRGAQAAASPPRAEAKPEAARDRPALDADTLISASTRLSAAASANPSDEMFKERTNEVQAILNCLLDVQSIHVDAVIESCQLPQQTVLNLLLELELRGLVVQHPGKLFSLP